MKYFLLLLLPSFLLFACSKPDLEKVYDDNKEKVTIQTGLWGTVGFRKGNCMPGWGRRSCQEYPVQRKVRIYAYTTLSQATKAGGIDNGFYTQFSTQLIRETETDRDGFFQAELPAGTYTLTVIENGNLYANQFEGTPPDLGINPFTITSGRLMKNVVIDYEAAY